MALGGRVHPRSARGRRGLPDPRGVHLEPAKGQGLHGRRARAADGLRGGLREDAALLLLRAAARVPLRARRSEAVLWRASQGLQVVTLRLTRQALFVFVVLSVVAVAVAGIAQHIVGDDSRRLLRGQAGEVGALLTNSFSGVDA